MVKLTRLNGEIIYVNSELIEQVEATPDTVIRMTTGSKLVVKETVDELIAQMIAYKRAIFQFPEGRD